MKARVEIRTLSQTHARARTHTRTHTHTHTHTRARVRVYTHTHTIQAYTHTLHDMCVYRDATLSDTCGALCVNEDESGNRNAGKIVSITSSTFESNGGSCAVGGAVRYVCGYVCVLY